MLNLAALRYSYTACTKIVILKYTLGGLTVLVFLKKYWPYIVAALLVAASYYGAFSYGKKTCDAVWSDTYNTLVEQHNLRVAEIEKESSTAANLVVTEVVEVERQVVKVVNNYVPAVGCDGNALTLPSSFVDAWNKLNETIK